MTLVRKLTRALVSTTVIASSIHPQPGPAKPTPASLAGLSYAYGDWSTAMPNDPGLVLLCYRLVPTNSASQPFTLEPTDFPETDGDSRIGASWEKKKRSPCTVLDAKHPLLERGILAVAIDSRAGGDSTPNIASMAVLHLNVTTQAGSPRNPSPVRPSISTGSITPQNARQVGKDQPTRRPSVFYLRWPIALGGDVRPTLSVNTIYIGPAPGDAWQPHTLYAPGTIVTNSTRNGHFDMAVNEGRSDSTGGAPAFPVTIPATVRDGGSAPTSFLTWMDIGTSLPSGFAASVPSSRYGIVKNGVPSISPESRMGTMFGCRS
jgi:hypothetical protein